MGSIGNAVLIAGPTASGKSALALEFAQRCDGVIVNTDSMQVYRDLRVLTARPSTNDEMLVPHRLYGHVDGSVNYSVGGYLRDVGETVRSIWAAGQLPIFVGGTGLYFKALIEGLSEIPPVPAHVRDRVRSDAEGRASEELHRALKARDPEMAGRIRPADRLRILRAFEVREATGRSLLSFQGKKQQGPLSRAQTVRIFLTPERATLRQQIDTRFLRMVEEGALDEMRALALRRLDPALPIMRAHGVPALLAHLRGELSLDEAIARGQADTRRYAKRQFTWFRHQMPGWLWATPDEARAVLAREVR
jgi:tRNA dimethylallyltransferase